MTFIINWVTPEYLIDCSVICVVTLYSISNIGHLKWKISSFYFINCIIPKARTITIEVCTIASCLFVLSSQHKASLAGFAKYIVILFKIFKYNLLSVSNSHWAVIDWSYQACCVLLSPETQNRIILTKNKYERSGISFWYHCKKWVKLALLEDRKPG